MPQDHPRGKPGPSPAGPVPLFEALVDAVDCQDWTAATLARDALRRLGWVVSQRGGSQGQGADLPGPDPAGAPAHRRKFELAGAST